MKPIKMLVMGLTGRCCLACRYCYAAAAPGRDMSFAAARRATDLAAASGERFILQLSGGEPLLVFPLIKELVGYIRENGIRAEVQLQTNAALVTEEIADFISRNGIAVGVSLDGRPETNDRQRTYPDGSGAANDAIAGISLLARRGVAVGLTCVVTDENVADLPGVVEMAYYLGNVRRIGFDLLRAQGRGCAMKPAQPEALGKALDKTWALADRMERLTGRRIVFSQVEQARAVSGRGAGAPDFSHCRAMNGEGLYADPEGRFFVCCSLAGDENFCVGDSERGIDGAKLENAADLIRRGMSYCRECPDFSSCGGGCFARWHGAGRSPEECVLKRAAIARASHSLPIICADADAR